MTRCLTSLFLIAALLFSGCSNQKEEKGDKLTLLLDWFPNPNHVVLFQALDKGLFEKEGLNVELLQIHNPSDAIPMLSTGKVDLAVSYPSTLLSARNRGASLMVAGTLIKEPLNCFLYLEGESIQSPSDLQGKVIGYSSNGFGSPVLDYIFNLHNIKPASTHNVNFDIISTLGNRQVDVTIGGYFNIETEQLAHLGVKVDYTKMTDFGVPTYPALIVISDKNNLKFQKEEAIKFKKVLSEAAALCKAAPSQAFEAYKRQNTGKTEENLAWEKRAWEKTYPLLAEEQTPNMQLWQTYADWLCEIHVLDKPIDVSNLFMEES